MKKGYLLLAISIALSLLVAILSVVLFHSTLFAVPVHYNRDEGQSAFVVSDLISTDVAEDLMKIVFEIGRSEGYSSNVDQNRAAGFKPLHEHIGEGIPINSNGSCSHSFLFPNIDKTLCVLPQRVDIGAKV